ncbi:unnamed protein product [Urochloa humidicola]
MVSYNFDLLDLADGESGDAAVSIVVGKKKNEAAAAKFADAVAKPAAQEKTKCFSYYTKLLHDSGVRICQQDLKRLSDALRKLNEEETKLREQPAGNEALLIELWDKQWKLRREQMKLREKEATLVQQRKAFYEENEIPLPEEMNPNNNSHGANADPGSNYNVANGNVYNNDGGSCGYSDCGGNNDHYQTQVCDSGEHYPHGHDHYNNGDRQGYHQGHQPRMEYVPKAKASSDAGEEKPEANVVSANGTEQKKASANNADDVPASESDNSATGIAAQGGPNNGQDAHPSTKYPFKKEKLNGSEKRKKKNAKKNSGTGPETVKKQDSEVDNSKKQGDKQPLEEEKKTLDEYERTRDEKKKSSKASKIEVRKVTAEAFEGLQMLERKKLDDEEAVIKVEKAQPKVKEEKPNNNSHGANAAGSNYNCVNGGGSCGYSDTAGNNDQHGTHVCEHYPHGHDVRQIGRGHDHYNNNGDRHLRQTDVDGHVTYNSKADAEIQDWVYIDMSEPNSVADAGIQDWEYIDISGPNNHTKGS